MTNRRLTEIASQIYYPSEGLSESCIDTALTEAGFDIHDERERVRFENLVKASDSLRKQDELASFGKFEQMARERCGSEAGIDELLYHAFQLSEMYRLNREDMGSDR